MSRPKSKVITVHVVGPLAAVRAADSRRCWPSVAIRHLSRVSQLQVMVHLSKWLRLAWPRRGRSDVCAGR